MENLYDNTPGVKELKTKDLVKKSDGNVLIGDNDFRNKVYLMVFYAPWCGHCVRMSDDIKKLGGALKDEGFMVGAINCDANDDLDSKIIINSFPTLYFVKDEKVVKYDGQRDLQSLLNHLCDTLGKCLRRK